MPQCIPSTTTTTKKHFNIKLQNRKIGSLKKINKIDNPVAKLVK
jgi:hypothetical protein